MTRSAILLLTGLGLSLPAQGHFIPGDEPVEVHANVVATWRSDEFVNQNEYWQLPGTLMGGHAWPHEEGVAVDDVSLSLGARLNERAFSVIEIGSHGGGDDHGDSVELQHAYLGYVCCEQKGPWVIEVGRMGAAFSPSLAAHAGDRLASESPLIDDVFWGRDFHDEGARLWWHETAGWSAGVEVWRGKAFPANTHGDGAWDVFARHQWQLGAFVAEVGGWYYQASASARADHRYGGGHTHTPVAPPGQTAKAFADVRYTGDIDLYGLHADLGYRLSDNWYLGLKGEWMQMAMDGMVHDGIGREAALDADQVGGWLQPYVTWRRHTIGIRIEVLSTDNNLAGAAAPILAEDTGLANFNDHDPMRYTAVWRYQWRDGLALRAEVIQDDAMVESDLRWAVGVVWQGSLWPLSSQGGGHQH